MRAFSISDIYLYGVLQRLAQGVVEEAGYATDQEQCCPPKRLRREISIDGGFDFTALPPLPHGERLEVCIAPEEYRPVDHSYDGLEQNHQNYGLECMVSPLMLPSPVLSCHYRQLLPTYSAGNPKIYNTEEYSRQRWELIAAANHRPLRQESVRASAVNGGVYYAYAA